MSTDRSANLAMEIFAHRLSDSPILRWKTGYRNSFVASLI
jgi:hypothetical protein